MLRFVLIIIIAFVLAKILGWVFSFLRALANAGRPGTGVRREGREFPPERSPHEDNAKSDVVDARFTDIPTEKKSGETD